jgi:hypothetical protein
MPDLLFFLALFLIWYIPITINELIYNSRQQYGLIGPCIRYWTTIGYYFLFALSVYYVIRTTLFELY